MDADKLSFIDNDAEDDTTETEVMAQPAPEAEAAAPEPAEKGETTEAAPPAAVESDAKHIPITALLDERERRQQAERELQELKRWRQEQEAKARQPAPQPPDFYTDPDQRLAFERSQFERSLFNERLNMSEMLARQAHGDTVVETARDAFMQEATRNPALAMELQRQANPYGFVVQWHRRQQAMAEIGDDPMAYRERLKAELLAELQGQQGAAQPSARNPVKPPASLSAAPSASRGEAQFSRGSAFDAAFGG